jgi:hypothetical protein
MLFMTKSACGSNSPPWSAKHSRKDVDMEACKVVCRSCVTSSDINKKHKAVDEDPEGEDEDHNTQEPSNEPALVLPRLSVGGLQVDLTDVT